MDGGGLGFGERGYGRLVAREGQHSSASVELVSTERLLAASLSSLNTLGRKMGGGGGVSGGPSLMSQSLNGSLASLNMTRYNNTLSEFAGDQEDERSFGAGER
eukprot:gene5149-6571_t